MDIIAQSGSSKRLLRGLSLIELMVVIAIIAVVSAISLVSFSTLTGDKLTNDARKIVNDLCWARQMAVAQNTNQIIRFNSTSERYSIYRTKEQPADLLKTQKLSPGIDLVSVTPAVNPLIFNTFPIPASGIANGNYNITLSGQGKTTTVRVFNTTGYVKIE